MQLVQGETKLSESNDGTIVLTSRRIRLDQGSGSGRQFVSITLDQVTSCSFTNRSFPFLFLLAVLFALAGFQMGGQRTSGTPFLVGTGLAALCVLGYFATRQQLVTVRSAADSIQFRTRGMSRAACIQFIDDLEGAKLRLWAGRLPSPGAA
jgi:hypothetical protein